MTLVEVVVALAITGLTVGGLITGYIFCMTSSEKDALAMAANTRAMERIEETRSAIWAPTRAQPVDELVATNFPDKTVTPGFVRIGFGQHVRHAQDGHLPDFTFSVFTVFATREENSRGLQLAIQGNRDGHLN